MIKGIRTELNDHIKNMVGWKAKRKIVVFSVDDYGNVRVASKKAREILDSEGYKVYSRFDAFDTLETTQDLEFLFEVLNTVKDSKGRCAVFTPFSLPCNIDFERVEEEGFENYRYELLPTTLKKLEANDPIAYTSTWKLWQQGINEKFFLPQFHGREHLNVKVFNEKIAKKDKELLTMLKWRSFTGMRNSGYNTISAVAAFDFWKFEENYAFDEIIQDGLSLFEKVFGYKATQFNPSTGKIHPYNYHKLAELGVNSIDISAIQKQHQGNGVYKVSFNYLGKKSHLGQNYIVRNVVFEPTSNKYEDPVAKAISQIEKAFLWGKPAIISSHRVNFCGYMDEENRKNGLSALKNLLLSIVKKWPEVEFMSASELGDVIRE